MIEENTYEWIQSLQGLTPEQRDELLTLIQWERDCGWEEGYDTAMQQTEDLERHRSGSRVEHLTY